jgi:two-component system, sensor histidine kinase and response regulator
MSTFRILFWLGALLLGFGGYLPAQELKNIRSHITIKDLGGSPPRDTAYVDTLDRLSRAYYGVDADSAFFYGRKALEYAAKTAYPRGEAESWRLLGNTYEMVGDYQNMLSCYQHSLDIAEKTGNTGLIAKVDVNFALFYKQEGAYDQAQQLMEKVSDLYRRSGDSSQSAYVFSHLADLAFRQHQYDEALGYAVRALGAARGVDDAPIVAACNNDVGRILAARGSYREALDHYLESLTYYREANDRLGTTATNSLLAEVYLRLKDVATALKYASESLEQARAMRRKPEIQGSARVLSEVYEAKGDYRNALRFFRLFKDYSDSLFNDELRKMILARAAQSEYENKAIRLREAQALKDAGYERALRKAALQIAITVAVIAVLSLLAFILLRSRTHNRRINRLLREKNEKIEEQKEVLERQAVQLLLNNQQKDKLFSIIAHDLHGPLNSLRGLMDLIKEKKLSEQEVRAMLNELKCNIDYSADLVGNLLFWASSQLNGMVVNPVILPLRELVLENFALFASQAREKQVLLTTEVPPLLLAFADKDMVHVVIRNLVSNAIKFSLRGGIVMVGCRRVDADIELCVADMGIGIREDDLERIRRRESFSSFGTAREQGTGLGMLLCHEFAEANGGRFLVESEWGKGTRCYFTIPVAPSSSSMML